MSSRQMRCSNRLLSIMGAEDFAALVDHLEPIDLPLGTPIGFAHEPIKYMYFLEEGVASLIAAADGVEVEAGLIGREGFAVPALALNVTQLPHGSRMQLAGHGYRIDRKIFVEQIEARPKLLHLMLRFAQCLVIQTSYTALANARYELDVRLARWLLMLHDRASSDDLPTTHEFLAIMLGVQRPTVTNGIHMLEGRRLVSAERRWITIRNRHALEAFAGSAYGTPENEYRRLIGPFAKETVAYEDVRAS